MDKINTRILITGATGFVGTRLLADMLENENMHLNIAIRNRYPLSNPKITSFPNLELSLETDWSAALNGCDTVIHLAARVHIMNETALDPLLEFRRVNVDGTLNLARQAANKGIKRFIFLSSIKVNGEITQRTKPFTAEDKAMPVDAYGISKYEAEQKLFALAKETGMEVVIIRTPLIYGPGVKGNFRQLLTIMRKSIPLPFKKTNNKRSFVGIYNLISLIKVCVSHPKAANEVFLVSDNDDLSTNDLLEKIAKVVNKKALLFPFPNVLLFIGAHLLGKKAIYHRLCKSLQVDISKTLTLLDWKPPYTVDEGLKEMIKSS